MAQPKRIPIPTIHPPIHLLKPPKRLLTRNSLPTKASSQTQTQTQIQARNPRLRRPLASENKPSQTLQLHNKLQHLATHTEKHHPANPPLNSSNNPSLLLPQEQHQCRHKIQQRGPKPRFPPFHEALAQQAADPSPLAPNSSTPRTPEAQVPTQLQHSAQTRQASRRLRPDHQRGTREMEL
jgi:hypothetical protein